MKKKLSRRDFLKLAGIGAAVTVPGALGYGVYRSAVGEPPPSVSPYVDDLFTTDLNGSLPILLVVNKDAPNPFGIYLGEILRAEGLNCFHTTDLSALKPDSLANYTIAILAETTLSMSQAEMFEAYVARGGSLVGMRPDERLSPIFGVERGEGSIAEGYLKTEALHSIGQGITSSTLQFHGAADLFKVAGAQPVARLYTDRESSSEFPAIAINLHGKGMTAIWAFDLAKCIAYMRQGNPAFKDQDRDGHPNIRATDMFAGWIDLERIQIPQADELQRLFVKTVQELAHEKIPLPRIWYLPAESDALFVATGDAHPISGSNAIADVLSRVEDRNGHMSIYYSFTLHDDFYRFAQRSRFYATRLPIVGGALAQRFRTPDPYQVNEWRSKGHEFTLHPHVGSGICGGYGDAGVIEFGSEEDGWDTYWRQFTGLGYGPVSSTVRTHCVLWKGWVDTAGLQAGHGIRMNLDYYHVGPLFRKLGGDWAFGHFTGSGLPMRFVDEQGRILDIYQQLTQLADEHLFSFPEINWVNVSDFSAEEATDISRELMKYNLVNGYPAVICANFHPDPFAYGGRPAEIAGRWLEGTLDYAVENGIPIWSARDWLGFTQARHDLGIRSLVWSENTLSFDLDATPVRMDAGIEVDDDLGLLVPVVHQGIQLHSMEVDGWPVDFKERLMGGILYGWVPVSMGRHQVKAWYSQ